MTLRALVLAFLAVLPAAAGAQAVVVEAPGAAAVYVDGMARGVPGQAIAVAAGPHEVAVVDDVAAWRPRRASARVEVGTGDTLLVRLQLPVRVRVETLPLRAEVALVRPDGTREPLGTAPLTADLAPDAGGRLEATAEGYAPASAPLAAGAVVLLTLPPLDPGTVPPAVRVARPRSGRTRLLDLGIGAATLAAGAVAVHFKFRADRVDDRYRGPDSPERGDEALRQEALRLDRISAVALGAMQVGVGVLAVRLVLR